MVLIGFSTRGTLNFVLPLSCMVVPIREVVNKHCSFFSAFSTNLAMTSYPSDIEMCGIDDSKSREHSAIFKCSSRKSLILSNASSISYHRRIKINNELSEEDSTNPVNSSYLSYTGTAKVGGSVSLATDKETASNRQQIEGGNSTSLELRLSIWNLGMASSILSCSMSQ